MLEVKMQSQFKRDIKLAKKRDKKMEKLKTVIDLLVAEKVLDETYNDHALKGNYIGFRDCHLEPDWLLIYQIDKSNNLLKLFRTGTHADLFGL